MASKFGMCHLSWQRTVGVVVDGVSEALGIRACVGGLLQLISACEFSGKIPAIDQPIK